MESCTGRPFVSRKGEITLSLDRAPARVRLEALAVRGLEVAHRLQPRVLAALADGGDGTAAMRREARSENHARVAKVRIRDDALAHARDRFVQRGHHHAIGERLQVRLSRGLLLRLALHPGVEALAALLAEMLRLDIRGAQL